MTLLGGFSFVHEDAPVALPRAAQSVLALLGVHGGRAGRQLVAATLWPDGDEQRARANLRTVMWRTPKQLRGTVVADEDMLALAPAVSCDVWEMTAQARRLIDAAGPPHPSDEPTGLFWGVLLPAWYDDWVLLERERLSQVRIQALEALCRALSAAGRYAEAIDTALEAIEAEPLRERAHRLLIEVHLAEGNLAEALHEYRCYEALLEEHLGVAPTASLRTSVHSALHR